MVKSLNREKISVFLIDNLVWIGVLILFILFSMTAGSSFFSSSNIRAFIKDASVLGGLALALGICIIAGSFDLSLAQVAAFTSGCGIYLYFWGLSWPLIIVAMVAIGALVGLMYGVLIGKMEIDSFLVTLAGFVIFQYAHRIVYIAAAGGFIEDSPLLFFGRGRILGTHISIPIFITLLVLVWALLRHTKTGFSIYAIGHSSKSAEIVGINPGNIKLLVHVMAGAIAGIVGVLLFGYVGGNITVNTIDGEIFTAFAAIAVGGISVHGGRGNLLNIFGGMILLSMVISGTAMFGIPANDRILIRGIVILVAVISFDRLNRKKDEILSRSS